MKEIKLTQGKIALVDDEDFEIVNQYKWYFATRYAKRAIRLNGKQEQILLHRFIYELHHGKIPKGYFVDHVDRNTSHNQINNLRLATPQENIRNRRRGSNNISGYRGVTKRVIIEKRHSIPWQKEYWKANIKSNGKHYVKYFPFTEEGKIQAAKWYDQKAKELFSEFCGELNFPDED